MFVLKAIWAVHTIPAVSSSDVKSVWRRVWTLYTLRFFCQKEKKEKDMWRHGRLLITQFISPKVQKKKSMMWFNLSQVGFKVTIYILTSPYSPLCSLYVFLVTDKDNLFNNQELLKLVIISSILVALTFVSGVKIAWRNKMLVTLRGQRLKGQKYLTVNRCFFSQHIMFG